MAIVIVSVLVLGALVSAVVLMVRSGRRSRADDADLAEWATEAGVRHERGPSPFPDLDLSLLDIRYGHKSIEYRLWPDSGPDHGFRLRGRGAGNQPDALYTCALAFMPTSMPRVVVESTFGVANVGKRLGLRSSGVEVVGLDDAGLGDAYRVSSDDAHVARTVIDRDVAEWLATHQESFRSLQVGIEIHADHVLIRTRPLEPRRSLELLVRARELRTLVVRHADG